MNVIMRPEFELAYYDSEIQRFHYNNNGRYLYKSTKPSD